MKIEDTNSEVKEINTIDTGGNISNDVIVLKDDSVVVITSDVICYYRTMDDYENNTNDEVGSINRF